MFAFAMPTLVEGRRAKPGPSLGDVRPGSAAQRGGPGSGHPPRDAPVPTPVPEASCQPGTRALVALVYYTVLISDNLNLTYLRKNIL